MFSLAGQVDRLAASRTSGNRWKTKVPGWKTQNGEGKVIVEEKVFVTSECLVCEKPHHGVREEGRWRDPVEQNE